MRKLKKINGYLIVKFNAREMQKMEQLGAYGVIDAELYTGHIEIDRGAMEYEDAETLEIAIEQARGLTSEFDVDETSATYTVIKEAGNREEVMVVEPELIVNEWKETLQKKIEDDHYPEITQETARHELSGFMAALCQLGIHDSDKCSVNLQHFEPVKVIDTVSTVEYLRRKLEMETHNLLCYSANYGMTKPREGYEEEWKKTARDCEVVEELIQNIEQMERRKPPKMQAASHYINLKEGIPESCSCGHTRQNSALHKQPPLSECSTNLGVIETTFLRMKAALKEACPNLVIPEDGD